MSFGGSDPLREGYLADLRAFFADFATPFHSDHACMSADGGRMLHDLLPLPLTHRTAEHVADRVKRAQDVLGLPLAIENVSFYLRPGKSELTEPLFIRSICERADCGFLFDVNNAVVNAMNFGLDANDWLANGPLDRVVQIHVAGHEWFDVEEGEMHNLGPSRPTAPTREGVDRLIVDTHGADANADVFRLLEGTLARTGAVPIVLERDHNMPALEGLLEEIARIRAIADRATKTS